MSINEVVDDILEHHGVKGQKWGVRRRGGNLTKLKRGAGHPISGDADSANKAHSVAKKSGTAALSNTDLQKLVTRMNLEQQFTKLSSSQKSAGQKFASDIITNIAKQQITSVANQAITKKVAGSIK